MATNKFPLVYNAYNQNEMDNYTTSNPLGLAKSVGGVAAIGAPILAAGAYANSRIASNEYRSIAGLRSNALGDASAKVGDSLRAIQDSQNTIRKMNQEKFKKKLLDGNFLDEIAGETERGQRAILNGILEALNETNIDAQQAATLKETLVDLVQSESLKIDEKNRETLKSVFGSVKDSNPEFFGRMSKNINFYKEIQDSLAAPLQLSHSSFNSSFSSIDYERLGVKAKGRFSKVQKAFANTNFNIEAIQVDEKVGNINSKALYARVSQGNRFNMIPIDLSDVTESIGAPLVRLGHGQQSFVSPMAIGRADIIKKEFLDKGSTFGTKDIENSLKGKQMNRPFMAVEDFIISNLSKIKEKKGRVSSDDIKLINEDIRGISENLNRTFSEDNFSQLSKSKIRSVGSSIGFVLDGLNPKSRRDFSANLIASQVDSGLVTGHSNMAVANMNNFSMVNLFMRDETKIKMENSFAESVGSGRSKDFVFEARGLESTFKIGNTKISDVTHAILPLTARPKQFWNNENFFANKVGGGINPLDSRKDRALMLLDMKESRLGLSEGEAYLSRGLVTKKVFPKTVMDPKTMGYAGSDLLNEMIRRSNQGLPNLVIGSGEVFKYGKDFVGIGDISKNPLRNKVSSNNAYFSLDDFFRAHGNKSGALTLGKMNSKVSEVPFYRGMKRLELGFAERTTDTGADLYRVVGMADIQDDFPKLFAEEVKTTVKPLSDSDSVDRLFKRYEDVEFGKLNIQDVISKKGKVENIAFGIGATEGSMLKKAHYYHTRQMTTAVEALSMFRGMDGEKVLESVTGRAEAIRAQEANKLGFQSFSEIDSVPKQQKIFTSSFVESITEFMGSKEFTKAGGTATAGEIGRTFGGFYKAFESGKEFSSMTSGEVMGAINRNIIKTNISSNQQKAFATSVDQEIRKGLAISLSLLRAGPGLATYRSNQASVEARLFNFLGMKLHKIGGMDVNQTSDFLFSLMSRKSDAGNELVALKEYLQFHEYAKSQESIFSAGKFKNMERVSLEDFVSMVGSETTADDQVSNFLKSKQGGFLLEFGEGTAASRALNKVFKGKGSLYLPAGEKFMEAIASQGTEMIKKEGTVMLSGEYKNQIKYFAKNISEFMNPSTNSLEEVRKAETSIRNFESKISEITGNSFKNIMKGKMKGSASLRSAGIKLDPMSGNLESGFYGGEVSDRIKKRKLAGVGRSAGEEIQPSLDITKKNRSSTNRLANIVMGQRKTQVAFVETQGFLAAMSDFIEGAKSGYSNVDTVKIRGEEFNLNAGQKARLGSQNAKKDAALKFQHFFLGSYEKYAKAQDTDGLLGIVSRHPILSTGHVQISSLLRYVPEARGMDSSLVNLYNNRDLMDTVESAFGKNIFDEGNFEKLSNIAAKGNLNKKQKRALTGKEGLFTYMSQNISKFQNGEGGGRIFFPDMEVDVHYGQDKVRRINFSLASAAIGDMDGDLFQLIMPSAKQSKILSEKLLSKSAREAAADELLYRGSLRMLFDEANDGIKELSKSLGDSASSPSRFLKDVAMKEILHKQVGPIDVALDSIRMGMVNMDFNKEQLRSVQSGLALLTVLEEVGTIKAKKLPKAIDFASIIADAANYAYDTGDVSKLRNITENFVFKGRDLSKGFDIKGLDLTGIGNKTTREAIESAFKNSKNNLFNMEEVFNLIALGAKHGKRTGTKSSKTTSGVRMVVTNQNESRYKLSNYLAMANDSNIARMAGREESEILESTKRSMRKMTSGFEELRSITGRKALGPAIAGVAGALGLAGLLGSSGSRPEPLLMPGEVTDNALGEKIAAGQLYDSRGSVTDMGNYSPGNGMNERPIIMNETRVEKNSGMLINGELPNEAAMHRVQQIMNSIGGNANYVINDTRGPMTMNFVNKYMGE